MRVYCLITAAALCLASPLWGQEIDIATLRTKDVLNDQDRAQLRNWLQAQIRTILDNDVTASTAAVNRLRENYQAGDAAAYRAAFAEMYLELVQPVLPRADLVAAVWLVVNAQQLQTTDAVPLYLAAIRDRRSGVRSAGAVGLRKLHGKIPANDAPRIIEGLREAAGKETAEVTLRNMYLAMDFTAGNSNFGNKQVVSAAVVGVLAERARQYERLKAEITSMAADITGLRIAARLKDALNDSQRKQLIEAAGSILRYAVHHKVEMLLKARQAAGDADDEDDEVSPGEMQHRNTIERLVIEAEAALEAVMPEAKIDVTGRMKEGDPTTMKTQFNEWARRIQDETGKNLHFSPQTASP